MNFIEFDYTSEDGIDMVVNGSGKVIHESNYSADIDNHKGYPLKMVTNIKFKFTTLEGSVVSNNELTEDDITNIEDIISNTLTENEVEHESDWYDRFED